MRTTRPSITGFSWELPDPQFFQEHPSRRIELTAEETEHVLRVAEEAKYTAGYGRWYKHKLLMDQQPKAYTVEEIWQWFHQEAIRRLGTPFVVDGNNKAIVRALCYYFAEDLRFETELGLSLEKGLLLRGPIGCGKTTILTIFQNNPRFPYRVVPCKQISHEYKQKDSGGPAALYDYKHLTPTAKGREAQLNYRLYRGHCFDDLGTEDWAAKHMGSQLNVLEDIISSRDDAVVAGEMPRFATHMTTNLRFNDWALPGEEGQPGKQVEGIDSIYGPRFRSRVRGMFNVLTFPEDAPDRRV